MSNPAPYSELEHLILAMVGEGVSSGYAMRKTMTRMKGGRWSSESGSVYRVLRRLEKDALVHEARRAGVPNRERTEYELSEAGEGVLREWLSIPPDRSEFAYLVDPIRTRAYFLNRLDPTERVQTVRTWITENKALMTELQNDASEREMPPVTAAAYSNLLYLAEARQEWLKRLLATVRKDPEATS